LGFIEAIKSGHARTFRFSGRSSRSEFWWVQLYAGLTLSIWLFLIQLSVMTRRFHDIGDSDWRREVGKRYSSMRWHKKNVVAPWT